MYKITIVYMDDKPLNIEIKDDQKMKAFFDAIYNGQFYFDEKGKGFWTDPSKIRHIVTDMIPDKKVESINAQNHMDDYSKET